MSKPKLNKTYSSFSRNPEINRAFEQRRDNDTIKSPTIGIYDVDYAIMDWLRSVIRPYIIENNRRLDVPVMYANGESWAQYQAKGFMYDKKGKIMTPLISLRRSSVVERDVLKTLGVNQNPEQNNLLFKNRFSTTNRYDRFAATYNKKRSHEYYIAPLPEYVDVSYEMLIWTEYQEQMNGVIEQIIPTNGFAWGTTWKFTTMMQDVSFETITATGEDRLVRATIPLTVKATLAMPSELRRSNVEKRISTKKIKFGEYTLDPFPTVPVPDESLYERVEDIPLVPAAFSFGASFGRDFGNNNPESREYGADFGDDFP